MLKQTKEFKGAKLIRTRDPKELGECDIVVDVGGEYDPAAHRYDHHQVRVICATTAMYSLVYFSAASPRPSMISIRSN